MDVKEVLTKARALVEKGWVQGSYAEDAEGLHVDPCSEDAVCWCAAGAIRAAVDDNAEQYYFLRKTLRQYTLIGVGIIHFNDTASAKEDVLALFDRAIADCK